MSGNRAALPRWARDPKWAWVCMAEIWVGALSSSATAGPLSPKVPWASGRAALGRATDCWGFWLEGFGKKQCGHPGGVCRAVILPEPGQTRGKSSGRR